MRVFVVLGFVVLSTGCSLLDQLALNGGYRLDPNKIYLGTSSVTVSARDMSNYACVGTPMVCEQAGISFECRCP